MGEKYTGVKFKVSFSSDTIVEENEIEEIVFWCNEFSRLKLAPTHVDGSYGNLSMRYKGGFLITATSLDLGTHLMPEDFVFVKSCDMKKFSVIVQGRKKPSSETVLHAHLYELRPDINAIFHGHSQEILSVATEFGIAQSPKELPYGTIELVQAAGYLATNNFFNLNNHGFFSLGNTANDAGNQAIAMLNRCSGITEN